MFSAIASHLRARSGWRAPVTAAALGALSSAALPPVHLVPVLWLAFPGLLILAGSRETAPGTFWVGWAWGFGHFAAGLYWISEALLTEAERFAWLLPIAVPSIAAGLALFVAVPVTLAMRWPEGWPRMLAFAALWTLSEMLRGVVLTGFPWNLIGTVWAFDALPLQGAAWIGTHGLSALTVVLACLPLVRGRAAWAAGAAILVGGAAFGLVRLLEEEPAPGPVALRIVQGNIAQAHKWREELRVAHFRRYLGLTASVPPAGEGERPLLVIWPETASPYLLENDEAARGYAAQALPEGALLIAGSVRIEREGGSSASPVRVWNSLLAIDPTGSVLATYDKHHLVPFGEYVPLRGILPVETVVPGNLDFSAGPGPVTVTLADARVPPFSPLICYEVIFPGDVVARAERPAWLLNITNDAWFGTSAGPYQHLAAARMRTIEEGLPLVRAANTGISAVFDARGRLVASLGLGVTGVIAAPLPAAREATPYARGGMWISGAVLFVLLGVATGLGRRGCVAS